MSTANNWDPNQYLKYERQRTKPAIDLLAAIELPSLKSAVDLGCGPGNSTILLKHRWPTATIYGVDNSTEMLNKARHTYPDLEFFNADINVWQPTQPLDLIFSNAALQWLGRHDVLFPRLLNSITSGGVLAVQMPSNVSSQTHQIIQQIAHSPSWSNKIKNTNLESPVHSVEFYYDILSAAHSIDIWETTYFHALDSALDIIEWLKATALRPVLGQLNDVDQEKFLSEYQSELAKFYVPRADGKVLLPYQRLFIVAHT